MGSVENNKMNKGKAENPARPKLVLVPAKTAGEKNAGYSAGDNIWFNQVRHLTGIWENLDFE